jgi:hypothetical protein
LRKKDSSDFDNRLKTQDSRVSGDAGEDTPVKNISK